MRGESTGVEAFISCRKLEFASHHCLGSSRRVNDDEAYKLEHAGLNKVALYSTSARVLTS